MTYSEPFLRPANDFMLPWDSNSSKKYDDDQRDSTTATSEESAEFNPEDAPVRRRRRVSFTHIETNEVMSLKNELSSKQRRQIWYNFREIDEFKYEYHLELQAKWREEEMAYRAAKHKSPIRKIKKLFCRSGKRLEMPTEGENTRQRAQ